MLERIVAGIALGLVNWLQRRAERGSVAVDADLDRDHLSLAADRLRVWLRENRAGVGSKSDQDRS